MQVTTELRGMFSYSISPIIILIIIIILLVIINHIKLKKKSPLYIIPNRKNVFAVKNKYLFKLNKLVDDLNREKIDNRKAFQALSNIIRNFIYEMTNIKVQNYTLSEIKEINISILTELVSEYYDPEFSKISKGNIIKSIEKTRKVIERWN